MELLSKQLKLNLNRIHPNYWTNICWYEDGHLCLLYTTAWPHNYDIICQGYTTIHPYLWLASLMSLIKYTIFRVFHSVEELCKYWGRRMESKIMLELLGLSLSICLSSAALYASTQLYLFKITKQQIVR